MRRGMIVEPWLTARSISFGMLTGEIRLGREHQDHDAALTNRIDDGLAIVEARKDIAGRNPAADAARFESGADSVRHRLVLRGITDEDIVGHRGNLSLLSHRQTIWPRAWILAWRCALRSVEHKKPKSQNVSRFISIDTAIHVQR